MKRKLLGIILSAVLLTTTVLTGCGSASAEKDGKVSITNVSYDPTRELYTSYNELFAKHWKEKTGQDVEVTQSHGGSGKQALEVANGLDADVVTLALEYDITSIQKAGLINDGWINKFDKDSSPYTSTIVFLVRKGNPKNIKDWDDLVKDGQGDVLLAWENEAYLSIKDHPDDYEIVTPSISILAQPSVAVVDDVVDRRGTRDVATEYLQYLYSDEAQRIAAENYYRPSNENILKEYSDKFNLNVNLVTIKDFGGWDAVQEKHFADGGVFDEIYEKK